LEAVVRRGNAPGKEVAKDPRPGEGWSGVIRTGRDKYGGLTKAYRMPLPADVDEFQVPKFSVLMKLVNNRSPEEALKHLKEKESWRLKRELGIYSPTPQYQPLQYIEDKPFWQSSKFVKRKMKKYYERQLVQRMEEDGINLRYLPSPRDRLQLAGTQLLGGINGFKVEKNSFKKLASMSAEEILEVASDQRYLRLSAASKDIPIDWRPGYQTTAIRDMQLEHMKRVDVVIEVRDARIPWTTTHPDVPEWARPRPRVIVLTKADLVPRAALEETIRYLNESDRDRGVPVIPVDALLGSFGIEELRTELLKAGAYVNRRRKRKGINPRAIRTMMIGFPNVGKSSIINRLTGRKVAARNGRPGLTRRLTWHKIGGFRNTELEFLDAPGFIPVGFGRRFTKEQQELLCMCRIFGETHVDRQQTGYDLVTRLGKLWKESPHLVDKTVWRETERIYGVDLQKAIRHEGPLLPKWVPVMNPDPFLGKMINDFNRGRWGKIQLESPPRAPVNLRDYVHLLEGSAQTVKHLEGKKIRGMLGPGQQIVKLPSEEPEKEKVPAMLRSANVAGEGLFDGW